MPNKQEIYLPGLNGLRAIAAFIVLFDHMATGLSRYGIVEPDILQFLFSDNSSRQAVNFFFVISGFLISYLLLIEKKNTGSISLKKFYIRRTLRIWPLYYAYLFIIIGISVVMKYSSAYPSFYYYLLFAGNAANSSLFLITHYWSLGVEEQFYIFWPALIKVFKRGQVWIIGSIVLVLTTVCFIHSFYNLSDNPITLFFAKSRFQCMIIGGLGAFAFINKPSIVKLCEDKIVQAACLIALLIMLLGLVDFLFFRDEVTSLLILIIIISLVSGKSYFLNLENKVFNFLGKISFGIYVLHPLVMWLLLRVSKKVIIPKEYLLWIVCILTPAITIVLAALSYKYLELKFLRLKKRFTVISSSNTQPSVNTITYKPAVDKVF